MDFGDFALYLKIFFPPKKTGKVQDYEVKSKGYTQIYEKKFTTPRRQTISRSHSRPQSPDTMSKRHKDLAELLGEVPKGDN